jgi:hypothetical protein
MQVLPKSDERMQVMPKPVLCPNSSHKLPRVPGGYVMCTLTSWIQGLHPAHSHGWGTDQLLALTAPW